MRDNKTPASQKNSTGTQYNLCFCQCRFLYYPLERIFVLCLICRLSFYEVLITLCQESRQNITQSKAMDDLGHRFLASYPDGWRWDKWRQGGWLLWKVDIFFIFRVPSFNVRLWNIIFHNRDFLWAVWCIRVWFFTRIINPRYIWLMGSLVSGLDALLSC